MESTRPSAGAQRIWLAISVALFLGAAYFVMIGYREPHHWLLLAGTFSNAMVFLALRRGRARAG